DAFGFNNGVGAERLKRHFLILRRGSPAQTFDQAIRENAMSEIGIFMSVLIFLTCCEGRPAFSLNQKVPLDIRCDQCSPGTNTPRMAGIEEAHDKAGLGLMQLIVNQLHWETGFCYYSRPVFPCQ